MIAVFLLPIHLRTAEPPKEVSAPNNTSADNAMETSIAGDNPNTDSVSACFMI